jgi:hypothetical protein
MAMDQSTILSIAMLGLFACTGGGFWMILKGGNRKRGLLLLVMAAVLAANIAILMVPVKS